MRALPLTKYIDEFYEGDTSEFKKDFGREVKDPAQYLVIVMCGYHRLVEVRAVRRRV